MADELDSRKAHFIIQTRRGYVGKVYETLEAIRTAFPYSRIEGNCVTVFSLAKTKTTRG